MFALMGVCAADVFVVPEYQFVIDFPEGFSLEDGTDDFSLLLFQHTMFPVGVMTKVWAHDAYADATAALQDTFAKLGGSGEIDQVRWRNRSCAIAQMSMQNAALDGAHAGWACAVPLSEQKGWLVLCAYAPEKEAESCEAFLLSILDSLLIDPGSYKEAGIVTAYAFPPGARTNITLEVGGKTVPTTLDEGDEEAAQFVIDREWAVFMPFASSPYWREAWQRFYRMIAKDSMGRLKRVAFDLQTALLADAKRMRPEQPEEALAEMLLHWTQYFPYERASQQADKADFASLPQVLKGNASDCDSRSMLLAVLLRAMQADACIFISAEYSHAILGVAFPDRQGYTITVDDKIFLAGETTAKDMPLGTIVADMQDSEKWIPVLFYE